MKKLTFLLAMLLISSGVFAQTKLVTHRGELELYEHEVLKPDMTGYSFYDMIGNGYWNGSRVLDYDSLNMTYKGNWPLGSSLSMGYTGSDNIFMVGSGAGVIMLDAGDPYNPVELSVVAARALVDASYYDAATQRLYLGAYFSGVEIWDMSDFSNPHRLARIPTSSYPRGGVFAEGNLVYAVTVADGIHIFDISDLNNIVETGAYLIPSSTLVWNSAKEGNLIYCACGNGGCRIVNVSDPVNPAIAGVVAGITTGVEVQDGFLYQIAYNYGLKVWNVSNPSSPQLAGQLAISGTPYRVDLKDNHAFVANATTNAGGGMNIIDVTNPASMQIVSTYAGYAEYIAVGEDVAVTTGSSFGCNVLDVTNLTAPQLGKNIVMHNMTEDVFVQGDLAIAPSNGFRVFDVGDKYHPFQIGFDPTPGSMAVISGDLAVYIPNSMGANNPVNVMDISDPLNPFLRGYYMAPVMTNDLVIVGHYAFIACWWDGFRVVDFSNPDAPVLAAHKFGWSNGAVPGVDFCYVQALDVSGNFLYLLDYQPFPEEVTKGLYSFDITDPTNPVFIGRLATLQSSGYDVKVQGNYAYVGDNLGGLEVIDVSDPANMMTVGYCYLPDVANAVDVEGNYAYVANYILGGVEVVDISFPASPFIAAYYKRSGCFGMGVSIEGSHTFLADGLAGFQIHENLIITGMGENVSGTVNNLNVYPNPANGVVNLDVMAETGGYYRVSVFDITGRLVNRVFEGNLNPGKHHLQWTTENTDIPASDGIYLVKVENGTTSFVSKVSLISK